MMSKCELHDEEDCFCPFLIEPGNVLAQTGFMDQTPVVNFAVKLLVREQQLVQKVLKH